MANENEIPLNITADTDAAQKQLEQFTAAITKLMGNLNQSIEGGIAKPLENVAKASKSNGDKIAGALTGIKVAAAAAFAVFAGREVIQFFENAIDEASQADQALQGLNFALASTGSFSEEASLALQDYAASIQKTTTFTDDAVIASLTLGKTFGLSTEKAKDLTAAAVNLAAVQGIDLSSATEKLLQSLNGQGKALKSLGPEFAKLTTEQLENGEAVKLIQKRYGDAASVLTNTFAGAVAQANNNLGEISESFGKTITQNKTVVAAIKIVSSAFEFLAEEIGKNKEGISAFVSASIRLFADFAALSIKAILLVSEGFLKLIELTGNGALRIKSAFQLITGDVDGLKESTKQLAEGGSDVTRFAKGLREGLTKLSTVADATAASIGKVGASNKSTGNSFQKISDAAEKASGGLGKNIEEALKFTKELALRSADAFDKLSLQRDEDLRQIRKYLNEGSLTYPQAYEARSKVERDFFRKSQDIRDKDRKEAKAAIDKFNDDYAKSLEDRKKIIEGAFKDPIQAAINFDTSAGNAKQVGAAIGLGIVSEMLNGAKGAQKILSAGIGAAAEAFLPGFGGAIGQITDQLLTLGPDGAKAMVREFVDALPDLITKLADAIPAVVEALVDSLITKGGIVKIAVALLRAMAGESLVKAIGKQIGVSFTEVASDELIKTARNMAIILSVPFFGAIYVFRNEIKQAFVDAANQIGPVFAVAGGQLAKGFKDGISGIFDGVAGIFASVGPLLSNPLSGALDRIPNLGDGISNKIKDAANYFKDRVDLPFDSIKDFLGKFKIEIPGFGGGSDRGAVTGIKGSPLATGGLVPPGFNNDTFPARLTSGELVIPKDLVGSLSDFLDVGLSPKKDNGDLNTAILGKIAALLGQPVNVESSINISGQVFADIMLKLSRNNARITA